MSCRRKKKTIVVFEYFVYFNRLEYQQNFSEWNEVTLAMYLKLWNWIYENDFQQMATRDLAGYDVSSSGQMVFPQEIEEDPSSSRWGANAIRGWKTAPRRY